jgi:hypothetical protein
MTLCLYAVLAAALARQRAWLFRWSVAGAVCVALALALDPFPRELRPGYAEAGAWLETHLQPGEAYAVDSRSQFEPEWFLPASNRMEIVSSAWERKPVPAHQLLEHFRGKGVRYVVIDTTSHKDGAPRYFFFDSLPARLPEGVREVWSTGVLQILEVEPRSAAPEAARAQ